MPVLPNVPCCMCVLVARVRGSVPTTVKVVPCAGCGRRLYAVASSRAMFAAGEAQPVCVDCLPSGPKLAVMSPEQAGELKAFRADDASRN